MEESPPVEVSVKVTVNGTVPKVGVAVKDAVSAVPLPGHPVNSTPRDSTMIDAALAFPMSIPSKL
jgi:hypothetical protein